MKKFLKLAVSLMLVLTTVFTLTGCSFDLSFYKKEEATSEKVSEITASINEKISENSPSYYKYEAVYNHDYTNTVYNYNTKYNVKMKVNGEAQVGEVFADKMHQPYRLPAINGGEEIIKLLADLGYKATICGAGPSILAVGKASGLEYKSLSSEIGLNWKVKSLKLCEKGATLK